jgi:benzoyl-CoA reductase subunit C
MSSRKHRFWEQAGRWEEIVAQCREIALDVQFPTVREWKERTGGKAVGCFPVYTPQELIAAAGALPVNLFGARGQIDIDHADSRIQSFVCSIARSTLELGLAGHLDWMDGMVVPSICDVARNLSGVWKHNFGKGSGVGGQGSGQKNSGFEIAERDKTPRAVPSKTSSAFVFYMHLPQNVESEAAQTYYRGELQRLRECLEEATGQRVTQESLGQAVREFNRNRALLNELGARRAARPEQWPASHVYALAAAGNAMARADHSALLERALELGAAQTRPKRDAVRVMLRGAFCEQPPLELLEVLEEAGCAVVDDDLQIGARFFLEPVPENGDAMGELVNAYLHGTVLTPVNNPGKRSRNADLVERCKARAIQGVVFASPKFCEPALYDGVLLRRAAERAGLPTLEFEYEEKMSVFESVRMQAETFVESILFFS